MPTNKQRRDAARRHLERQLQRRQERAQSRRRFTLIASIAGTAVLVVVIIIFIASTTNDDKKGKSAAGSGTPTSTASPTGSTSASPSATPSTSYPAATGASVSFDGVTVKGAADLKGAPGVTSKASTDPTKLEYKDLVVGKGAAATPTSAVTVQYYGALYKTGTEFDSSWSRGSPASFTLGPGNVIDGFTDGIGGTSGVPPMKIGGRRIIIIPASLGYGSQANGSIPANSTLVFIVDLTKATASGS